MASLWVEGGGSAAGALAGVGGGGSETESPYWTFSGAWREIEAATHCNTLQHIATHCNTERDSVALLKGFRCMWKERKMRAKRERERQSRRQSVLQCVAMCCSVLQLVARI